MSEQHPEMGRTVEVGSRKARVDVNHCADVDKGRKFAVFKHTHYISRWYYDGYEAFATVDEAITRRDQWLKEPHG